MTTAAPHEHEPRIAQTTSFQSSGEDIPAATPNYQPGALGQPRLRARTELTRSADNRGADRNGRYTEQMFSDRLTGKRARILNFITDLWGRSRVYPSLREIQKHCGYRSVNAVWDHLAALEKKGAILRIRGKARAYKLMDSPGSHVVRAPLLGTVPAGHPSEAGSDYEDTVLIGRTLDRDLTGLADAIFVRRDDLQI